MTLGYSVVNLLFRGIGMKTRGAFNLFLASVSAALTLALLNVWGRPEWFDLFPLSYALRFFQSLRTYTASCLVFFAFLTLRRAGGKRCVGRAYGALFAACFAPVAVYAALTLCRTELGVVDIFTQAACILSWACAAVASAVLVFGRRGRLPLYLYCFQPELLSPSSSAASAALYSLSPREAEILDRILLGKSNREIAESLFISLPTVKTHIAHILEKTGARSRLEVFALCARTVRKRG